MSALSANARAAWDATDSNLFSLEDFDSNGQPQSKDAAAGSTDAAQAAAIPLSTAPMTAAPAPAVRTTQTLSTRHNELLEERVRQLKQKEKSVGRRKARRQENTRMASNPHIAAPTHSDLRNVGSSNRVLSTFTSPLPEVLRAPGEGLLLKEVRPERIESAVVSARDGKYTLSLRDARRILNKRGALHYQELPPTCENWMAAATSVGDNNRRRSLGVIEESDDDDEDDGDDDDDAGSGSGASDDRGNDSGSKRRREGRPHHGPLQAALLKAAKEISEWTDSLVVTKPDAQNGLQGSITDLREAALDQIQAAKQATISPPQEISGDFAAGDTTLASSTYEARRSEWPPRSSTQQQQQQAAAPPEQDGFWVEVERTPQYMCWIVEDAFDRLMLHCIARIYGCGSFSCDERWNKAKARDRAAAATNEEAEREDVIRCTYIFNPRRGVGGRNSLKSGSSGARRRRGRKSGRSKRDSSVASNSSVATASTLGLDSDTDEAFSIISVTDQYSLSDFDTAASDAMEDM